MPEPRGPAAGRSRLGTVPTFKPAYVIPGDDHGRIAERRGRVPRRARPPAGPRGGAGVAGRAAPPPPGAPAARALEAGDGATVGVEEVEGAAAPSAERQVWGLVDALVGRDRAHATRAFLELRAQGEALPRLIPLMARRIRDVLAIAVRLEAGESAAPGKASLKTSSWMADRRIKEARAPDAEAPQRRLE